MDLNLMEAGSLDGLSQEELRGKLEALRANRAEQRGAFQEHYKGECAKVRAKLQELAAAAQAAKE